MYHRIGAAAYKADLKNTLEMCALLGEPHQAFATIHIAGTNGKGSVSHLLASVFQQAGYKTGLFTSPHLKDFRERIRINGRLIPKKDVTNFVRQWSKPFEPIHPSFFEWTAALAFDYFRDQEVDLAIIETGMGGRLDSTNVITPLLSVITNIGWDHMAFLGNTLPKIAGEKAGIIKQGKPVVIGETQSEVKDVFLSKAAEMQSPICFADEQLRAWLIKGFEKENPGSIYSVADKTGKEIIPELFLPLSGVYQQKNILTVITALLYLQNSFPELTIPVIKDGVANVVKNTHLQGRWQVLRKRPLTICDVGHNKEGIEVVVSQIRKIPFEKLHFVFGMVNDKDLALILPLLPAEAVYYFCKPDIPRGIDAELLQEHASRFGLRGNAYSSVTVAYRAAMSSAGRNDLVFAGGSTFVVAEIL